MHTRIHTLLAGLLACLLFSCAEDTDPRLDEQSFIKIYDNNQFNASYNPIDLEQTTDGGYLVLASRRLSNSDFLGIYMMKIDKNGNFVKDVEIDQQYVNPLTQLMVVDGTFYFFCMEELTLQAHIASVDGNLDDVSISPVQGGLSYPSAVSLEGNSFILLSFDHIDKRSVLSRISLTGAIQASRGFTIGVGEDVEVPIINHFISAGKKLPFATGRVPGGPYYFNGFFNYTFSLTFTNLSADNPTGVVQGQHDDGGFSAVTPIAGNKFAAARFNFGDNYLMPNVTLPVNNITSSVDYPGLSLPELVPNANVRILRAVINSSNTLIFASDTKSKQIALLFYDEATGVLVGSHYLGFSNPFEIADLVQTDDEGLAICGTTYMAGRFPRICLFKLSKEELQSKIKVKN